MSRRCGTIVTQKTFRIPHDKQIDNLRLQHDIQS